MRWVVLVAGLLGAGGVTLFAVQNSARTTQLSLDLGVAAWQLAQPAPVPALLGAAFGLGLLAGFLPMALRSFSLSARVRELESQQAMSQAGAKEPGAW